MRMPGGTQRPASAFLRSLANVDTIGATRLDSAGCAIRYYVTIAAYVGPHDEPGGPRVEHAISPATIAEIELALSQVAEIKAARVVVSDEGAIQEIHVLALPTKSPKQVVRDIESTIMAAFGIAIDHRMVSIAQLGQDSMPEQEQRDRPRARIKSINAEIAGVHANITVILDLEGDAYVGVAAGPASETARKRLVAQATLNAVEEYLRGTMSFALEDVEIVKLGRESVAVACVTLVSSFGEQALSGAALVRNNDKDSIVKATLDAINRRIGFLTTP